MNRVGERYFSQVVRNGHHVRPDDIARFASLGIRVLRYPVLWEQLAPHGLAQADWSWCARLAALREAGITPIAGLVHHGSGPRHTSLVAEDFAPGLAAYAGALAERCPWLRAFTPVNEPLTTARFSTLYGLWYPHARSDALFVRAVLNQCRATVLAMAAIRRHIPDAQLIQTDDLGKHAGTAPHGVLAEFYDARRWLAWDLLCGEVGRTHPLWRYLRRSGLSEDEILWFRANPCPPDIIGINYYITSERWLDHRVGRYPRRYAGQVDGRPLADVESVRVAEAPPPSLLARLREAWDRYRIPLAVTEAHLGGHREDQLRWLWEVWRAAEAARAEGIAVRAVTAWSLLGAYDWNSLVTQDKGYYEPGPFDSRSTPPRETAVAAMLRELARPQAPRHPLLQGEGWWRRPTRFMQRGRGQPLPLSNAHPDEAGVQPVLITGATGTLGQAFARICQRRNIAYRLVRRQELDIADPASVRAALDAWRPWALINASGYVRVDEAERDPERCFRENALGPATLAQACAARGVQLLTFSSDLVFSGRAQSPYVESDSVGPINIYGRSKAEAEARVLDHLPEALIVRSSAFFGPWDRYNFVIQSLRTLAAGEPLFVPRDLTVSPTYVPDLVDACLDLLIDGAAGIWHLTNGVAVTWAELAQQAARRGRVDPSRLEPVAAAACRFVAPRPAFSALHSERAILLPPLSDALGRFVQAIRQHPIEN
ncbi:sugar nucleotide-binding protein [Massilia sp. TS11]|uniref:sugar nucleotide-binding protein n=1 Tax=Massilia sp. TS11 TaxID=2908003 RepID=UPI001EDBE03A|nr:sugar nucleotide-binding protein [Massilia sp. TS11]MCG2586903.1 sugar nucleotide-binding protein [Massilia sp. TS11]